jgi:hypothetical protein
MQQRKELEMSKKDSLSFDIEGNIVEATYKVVNPAEFPLWFKQLFSLSESKRKDIVKKMMKAVKESNPEAYEFIQKAKCKLVGVQPRVEYALIDSKEGDTSCTWVHGFSMATLLFWCEEGSFGLFINPVLKYDDSVLNKISGNKKQSIKGFTG